MKKINRKSIARRAVLYIGMVPTMERLRQVAETFYKNMQKNKEQPFGYSYIYIHHIFDSLIAITAAYNSSTDLKRSLMSVLVPLRQNALMAPSFCFETFVFPVNTK